MACVHIGSWQWSVNNNSVNNNIFRPFLLTNKAWYLYVLSYIKMVPLSSCSTKIRVKKRGLEMDEVGVPSADSLSAAVDSVVQGHLPPDTLPASPPPGPSGFGKEEMEEGVAGEELYPPMLPASLERMASEDSIVSAASEDSQLKWVIQWDTRPRFTTATWRCRKNFSQWERSFHWKLRCHWLEFLRQIAVVRQGPGEWEMEQWTTDL